MDFSLFTLHFSLNDTFLHPSLNWFRRAFEDVAVVAHPSEESCASRRITIPCKQLCQLANQYATIARSHRLGKLHLRSLRLYQLILLLQRPIRNPQRLGKNRLLVVLIIKRNVATRLAYLRKHLRSAPSLKLSCPWQLRLEDERVETRLVDDGRLLSSTKGVAIRDALIILVHMLVKGITHVAVSQNRRYIFAYKPRLTLLIIHRPNPSNSGLSKI